jgi:hypothetical protein
MPMFFGKSQLGTKIASTSARDARPDISMCRATDWSIENVKGFYFPTFAATAFVLGAVCTQSASAGTVLNENFDEQTTGLTITSVGAFSAINGTNVDIVYNTMGFGPLCAGPESGNCVDLAGTNGSSNGILQSNTQFAAGQYLLSFDLAGSSRGQTDTTNVTFGDYSHTFALGSGDVTDGIVSNVLATLSSPGYLTFSESPPDGNSNIGNVLDNVSITAAAVPEPFTLSLFDAGLAGAVAMLRRRNPIR